MQLSALALATLLATANAHFTVYYPGWRGDSHPTQTQGPCGGLNKIGERFKVNGKSVDVLLKTSHTSAITEYRLCLGDDCGTKSGSDGQKDFSKVLYGPINELGAGNFCMPGLPLGDLKDGQKGTIQVIMQAVDGNLYNCIDFEVDNSVDAFNAVCKNSTGVSAEAISNANAGSLAENTQGSGNSSGHAHGSSGSGSASASKTDSKSSAASGSASATSAAASSAASSAAASASATEEKNSGSLAYVNGALAIGGVVAAALLI
ncbi:hypothetical protein B0I72DRAFT_132873 [Yarrowia lipolytica]|jgi:hypothetical protein|uniref:Lytic polysaccharide monooxygenase-like protein X325 n=2 Tax=Yarrowia lipolytica TaxID=4952 RepID=X325_YARLI|nr:YALI0F24255p [Yarrowia lipolytica CLIB122]AOW07638.1 hypothetical protein YALI1_F31672g [Yarrowia lipolytica]KAB8284449.1 hypothetical protein BKA91DRAFT_134830 [Yarrowia lipolytica]KAE8174510.1 hypothetical protein BKA90DRAFT_134080 [Yarrowia lipolytica]KAJ8055297.1 hypothetical protein LXG23DRAFT_47342 [Yarrowia lipolytica]QNP99710.1 Hypothetical protein YALI2_E01026g [Yarrowia lipolytica]|eukprot:XP_505821.1 YALI0F24255p [Yarrowia lipolytica CLIB122]